MAEKIVIPREGQGMVSAVITEWFVEVGDAVSFGDELCEVESEKASFPIEAAVAGTVLAICFDAGETAPVLETIAVIGTPGEDFGHLLSGATEAEVPDAGGSATREPPRQEQTAEPTPSKRRISPRAKRFAEAHGVDIGAIAADPIRERDVAAYVDEKKARTPSTVAETAGRLVPTAEGVFVAESTIGGARSQSVPLTNMRRIIAEKIHTSVRSSAQFTLHSFADATKLLAYHRKIKESSLVGIRITLNDLFLFITARTLGDFHELNAHFDKQRYIVFESVNLGVAVDVPGGLLVPVIKNAQLLRLEELAQASADAIEKSRSGEIRPADLGSGTFTVSNLGPVGIEHFTPILNYPEVAILGIGGIYPRPIRTGKGVEHIDCVGLSLTVNHQVVDGAVGAKYLQAFAQNAAEIDLLLAM